MKIISAEEVVRNLSAKKGNELMEKVFRDEQEGKCIQYLRTAIPMSNQNIMAAMPGYFYDGYFGMKILSVYPGNSKEGYPSHQGEVLIFEETHGELVGMVDAMSITGIRTGCCSAVASKYLAREDSSSLALIGCGHQGYSHLAALQEFFTFTSIQVFDLEEAKAEQFATDAFQTYELPVEVCSSIEEAVKDADIICTLTASKEPILKREWIKKGAHINAVGACVKSARELPSELVKDSRFFGDSITSVQHESGDYLLAIEDGCITKDHLLGTIGQVICGEIEGRTSQEDITIFESLGMAVEDLIVAQYLLQQDE